MTNHINDHNSCQNDDVVLDGNNIYPVEILQEKNAFDTFAADWTDRTNSCSKCMKSPLTDESFGPATSILNVDLKKRFPLPHPQKVFLPGKFHMCFWIWVASGWQRRVRVPACLQRIVSYPSLMLASNKKVSLPCESWNHLQKPMTFPSSDNASIHFAPMLIFFETIK